MYTVPDHDLIEAFYVIAEEARVNAPGTYIPQVSADFWSKMRRRMDIELQAWRRMGYYTEES